MFREFGAPLAEAKSVPLGRQADFARLVHNMEHAVSHGVVEFTPRAVLIDKAQALIATAQTSNHCAPAEASKIHGVLNFLFTGTFGKLGRGGVGPLHQRMYWDTAPYILSGMLCHALTFNDNLIVTAPTRQVMLAGHAMPRTSHGNR